MNTKNFIVATVGLILLSIPLLTFVFFVADYSPIILIRRIIIQPVFPNLGVTGALIAEFIYLFIVGVVVAVLNLRKYIFIPLIILIVSILHQIDQYQTWGSIQALSSVSVFVSMLIFVSAGYLLAIKFISKRF